MSPVVCFFFALNLGALGFRSDTLDFPFISFSSVSCQACDAMDDWERRAQRTTDETLGLAIGLRRMGKAARSTACHASSQVGRGKFLSGKFLHGCTICQPEVAQVLFSFVWFIVFRYFFNGVLPEFIAKQPTSNGK